MHTTTIRQACTLAAISALALTAGLAHAKEGGDQSPNGAENWLGGAVPPPGQYFLGYAGHYSGKLRDGDGNQVNAGGRTPTVDASFVVGRYVNVTQTTLFGANYGWQVIVPVVHQAIDVAPLGGRVTSDGLADMVVTPILLGWHTPTLHTVAAVDLILPTGRYDKADPRKSIGANYVSVEPLYGMTYLNDGWEVTGKFMLNFKGRNDDTNYRSGTDFHTDYLVGRKFGPVDIGLSGYYLKQLNDDKQNGLKVGSDGNRGEVFAIGPSLKYTTAGGVHLMASWQHETMVKNRFGGDKLWLKAIVPLN